VAGEGTRGAEAQGLSRREVVVTDTDEAKRKRGEAIRKALAARSPEARSEAARKAAETRRRNREAAKGETPG
jgi:hypothetical protein